MASGRRDAASQSVLDGFCDRLGHTFDDRTLLIEALTHSSLAGQRRPGVRTNERLEFLGDRVLGLIIADLLLSQFPDETEGELARRHAALVCREALAEVAESIDLASCLLLARGEDDAGGRSNPGLLADACEAVIAAVYLDGGFAAASACVRRFWRPLVDRNPEPVKDAKSMLQEWAQGRGLPLPVYTEIGRTGPAHAPVFRIQVTLSGRDPAEGEGASKRIAEQAAALAMLDSLSHAPGG